MQGLPRIDADSVDEGAVAAVEIDDGILAVFKEHFGVGARNAGVRQDNVAAGQAAYGEWRMRDRAGLAILAIDEHKLELVRVGEHDRDFILKLRRKRRNLTDGAGYTGWKGAS